MKTPTTPRPKNHDPEVIRAAAEKFAPQVVEWCNDESPLEDVTNDLVKAMRFCSDGYKIAKELDHIYSPDARLVEILDSAGMFKSSAREAACEKWVKENEMEAPLIGASVTCSKHSDAGIGVVVRNFKDGRSTVSFSSMGHVLEGKGTHGFILDWETLELVELNAEASRPAVSTIPNS